MARIRSIKPEFFTSENIVSMTPLSRLFYVSLWIESDREGRLHWNPRTLRNRYFPDPEDESIDRANMDAMTEELLDRGHLKLYSVDGKTYGYLPTFLTHQVINNREAQSAIPAFEPRFELTRESGVKDAACGKGRKEGKEGKGRELAHVNGHSVPAIQDTLFAPLRNAFQSKNPLWPKADQEVQALHWLVDAFKVAAPDAPEQAALRSLEKFWELTQTGRDFWKRQVFVPSRMKALWGDLMKEIELDTGLKADLADTGWEAFEAAQR